ncbi:MAG: hypothetical protein ACFFER_19250 [Candidatus Thorarchaeota archaeon]
MMEKRKKKEKERGEKKDKTSVDIDCQPLFHASLAHSTMELSPSLLGTLTIPEQKSMSPSHSSATLPEDDSRLKMVVDHYVGKYMLPHLASKSQRAVLLELSDAPKSLHAIKDAVDASGPAVHQTLKRLVKRGLAIKGSEGYVCSRIGEIVRTFYPAFEEGQLKPFGHESGSEKRYDLMLRMYLSQSLGADGVRLTSLARQLSYSTGYLSDMLRSLVEVHIVASTEDWGHPYSLSEIGMELVKVAQKLISEIVKGICSGITASPPNEYELTPEGVIKPAECDRSYHRIHFDGHSVKFTRL